MARLTLSSRLPADLTPSPLHLALQSESGPKPIDLTQSNPTVCGFAYPALTTPVVGPDTWRYAPEATGTQTARAALASFLQSQGLEVTPEQIVLTASTSEAFSTLFKLLCDPGSYVATATPGYPLVPHLAELDAVLLRYFKWQTDSRQAQLDWVSVQKALARGARALVLVQPSSPLGQSLAPADLERLSSLCTQAGAVLIIDAVFDAYTPAQQLVALPDALQKKGATVVLGGLSKAGGMPQLKLGWMLVYGEHAWTGPLLGGLEWIGDAYLSVNTPVQTALPALLPHLGAIQTQIRQRIAYNYNALSSALKDVPGLLVRPYQGGWYAVVEGPASADEAYVARLLRRDAGVLVHPGYFYDFEEAGYWVLSLIVPATDMQAALPRMAAVLSAGVWAPNQGVES